MSRQLFCHVCSSEILRQHGKFEMDTRWWPRHASHVVNGVSVCNDHLASEIVRAAGNPVVSDVMAQVDDVALNRHEPYLDHDRLRRLQDLSTNIRAAALNNFHTTYRSALVELAALAVAAVENLDRLEAA